MITCRLYGRTGNQMFQIAATIGHAKKYGYEWLIPRETIAPNVWISHPFSHLPVYNDYFQNINKVWKEPGHNYHEIPAEDDIIIDGYYQSPKYFDHCIDYVREQFRVPEPTENDRNKIIIHIRRGDYVLYPDKHPVLPESYYHNAIDKIAFARHGIMPIDIVGDDPEYMNIIKNYLIEILDNNYNVSYPIKIISEDYLTDFYKLCSYKYVVISNSSFSLMAAILNRNPDKVIMAPDKSQWFGIGNAHLDTSDIYPEYFSEIKY